MLRRGADELHSRARSRRRSTRSAASSRPTARRARPASTSRSSGATLEPFADLVATLLTQARPSIEASSSASSARPRPSSSRRATAIARSRAAAFRRTLFGGHPYGRRVAGTIPTHRVARPGRRGRLLRQALRARERGRRDLRRRRRGRGQGARRALARRLAEGRARRRPDSRAAVKKGRHLVFVDKPDRTQTQMVIGGLGTHAHDADHVPLMVANTAFGGTFTSRLMQEVRAKRGWSYGAYVARRLRSTARRVHDVDRARRDRRRRVPDARARAPPHVPRRRASPRKSSSS